MRAAAIAIVASVAGFVALEGSAMRLYPGGTWWDPTTVGYRFWQNYLCDLEWHVGLNGQDNTAGAHLAKAAMLVLLAGLTAFWLAAPALFAPGGPRGGRCARAVPALGIASVAGTVAVTLMPSDRFPVLHGAMVIGAGVPGLAAAALTTRALLARGSRWPGGGRLGAALFFVALLDLALYTMHWAAGDNATPLLPAIQKVALFLLLGWMQGVALRVMRVSRAAP